MLGRITAIAAALVGAQLVCGQFPPEPENVTILNSKFGDGVYISYKEVSGCSMLAMYPSRVSTVY
jgi:hypothetical protein